MGEFHKSPSQIIKNIYDDTRKVVNVSAESWLEQVSFGNISNYSDKTMQARADGLTSVEKTAWNEPGIFVYPTTPDVLVLNSTDAGDNPSGGGAAAVFVEGVGPGFIAQSEVFVLDGLSDVTSISTWLRVNRTVVISLGSSATYGGGNLGIVRASVGGLVVDRIDIGDGLSSVGVFSCPIGFKCKFQFGQPSVEANKAVLSTLHSISFDTGVRIIPSEAVTLTQQPVSTPLAGAFPEKTDIELRVSMVSGTGSFKEPLIFLLEEQP